MFSTCQQFRYSIQLVVDVYWLFAMIAFSLTIDQTLPLPLAGPALLTAGDQMISWVDRPLLTESIGYVIQLRSRPDRDATVKKQGKGGPAMVPSSSSSLVVIPPSSSSSSSSSLPWVFYLGKVVGFDAEKQTVRVQFVPTADQNHRQFAPSSSSAAAAAAAAPSSSSALAMTTKTIPTMSDYEDVPYSSSEIAWMLTPMIAKSQVGISHGTSHVLSIYPIHAHISLTLNTF